jgi:hypothetical protein
MTLLRLALAKVMRSRQEIGSDAAHRIGPAAAASMDFFGQAVNVIIT